MDEHDDTHDDIHDETHGDIRALLADLGTPPLPADVAARLDDVLTDLSAEADVVPLTPRVRRRWGAVLVAASVTAVVGLGLTQVLGPDAQTTSTNDTLGDTAARAEAAEDAGGDTVREAAPQGASSGEGAQQDPESGSGAAAADPLGSFAAAARVVPAVRSDAFALTAPGLVAALEADPASPREDAAPRSGLTDLTNQRRAARAAACAAVPPVADVDRVWPIRLDGRRGVLVLRAAGTAGAGPDERVAEAWRCADLAADHAAPARASTLVPVP